MADENEANGLGRKPDSNPTSGIQVQATEMQDKLCSESRAATHKRANSTGDVASEIRKGEKWVIGLQLLTLFFTALTAWIYYGQLREMAGESGQTDALTRAYRRLADSAGKQADASGRQASATEAEANDAKAQADASRTIAEGATVQADATNRLSAAANQTVDDSRLTTFRDLRPYVYATKVDFIGDVFKGDSIQGMATAFNSGRTPAVAVHGCGDIALMTNGQPMTDDFPCPNPNNPAQTNTGERSDFVLGSGIEDNTIKSPGTTIRPLGLSTEQFRKLITGGQVRIYFYGDIYYSDMTQPREVFHSTFCGRYNGTTDSLDICEKHNKMY